MSNGQRKLVRSIAFDPELHEYVSRLANQLDRSRSWVVNRLIREHAQLVKEKTVEPSLSNPFPVVINA